MLRASAGRKGMLHTYDTLSAYLPQAIEVLIDCIQNVLVLDSQVEHKLAAAQEELQELEQESLHLVGYSGALGNPLFPTEEALGRISCSVICMFYFTLQGLCCLICPRDPLCTNQSLHILVEVSGTEQTVSSTRLASRERSYNHDCHTDLDGWCCFILHWWSWNRTTFPTLSSSSQRVSFNRINFSI